MKKTMRMLALILAMLSMLSVAAFATGESTPEIVSALPTGGGSVEFAAGGTEKINVTYNNSDIETGKYYLVLMLATGSTTIDKDSILYIDQITATTAGTITFSVYPETMKNGAIMVVAEGLEDTDSLAGVKIAEVKGIIEITYILGDGDGDNEVTSIDIMVLAREIVGYTNVGDINREALDVDGDKELTSIDIMLIARFIVGYIDVFPVG